MVNIYFQRSVVFHFKMSSKSGYDEEMLPTPEEALAEIDKLEAEVRDLRRALQQEQDETEHYSEILSRDLAETDRLLEDGSRKLMETRQLEEREEFLRRTCHDIEQSTALLAQLEIQSRTRMEQEMEATARLEMELSCTLDEMRGRVLVVEQDFRSMKGFENIENLSTQVKERKEMLNKRVEELEMKMRNQVTLKGWVG